MSTRIVNTVTQVYHNNFVSLEPTSSMFATDASTGDPMVGTGGRIGDEITLKGVMFKMMIELEIRFSDVTARLMLIKRAKGDTPTRATLFAGLSGNKMIDQINKERYTIVAQKYVKMKASNRGTFGAEVGTVLPIPVVLNSEIT